MIKGGYYLKAKQIKKSKISTAPPYMREIWDYLLRESKFKDTKNKDFIVKAGQVFTSYDGIIDDLVWFVGNRPHRYKRDHVHKAFKFLRKEKMITTKKKLRGVLVTICNYSYFQNWRNYESHLQKEEYINNSNGLQDKKNSESHLKQGESHSESHSESHLQDGGESHLQKEESYCNINELQEEKNNESYLQTGIESHSESHTKATSIIEYTTEYKNKSIVYNIPCMAHETYFERDRRFFLECFPGVKIIQTFDDDPYRKDKSLTKQVLIKDCLNITLSQSLEKGNEQGAGIYLCINETNGKSKSRKATDIVRVRAVFADFDGQPIDDVWQFRPSMVVESSEGKYHAYWLAELDELNGVPLESFSILQESISVRFGSDPKVKDLPRVMRIPGFQHMKAEPFMSKIIHFENIRYDFGSLVELFPPQPRKVWSAPKYQKPIEKDPNAEFKGEYGASEGGRNCHITSRIGGMINRGLSWSQIEEEAYKEAVACNPPLPESETRAILQSMRRYA